MDGTWVELADSGSIERVCQLAQAVYAQIELVRSNAAAARTVLAGLGDGHDVLALNDDVDAAEAAKVVALEREILPIDAALELLEQGDAAARSSDSTPDLSLARAAVLALPPCPIEPADILIAGGSGADGRSYVIAPRGIHVKDTVLSAPCRQVHPGSNAVLELRLAAGITAGATLEELRLTLDGLARHTRVRASLKSTTSLSESTYTPLPVALHSEPSRQCLLISMSVPDTQLTDAALVIESIQVAGQPLPHSSAEGVLSALADDLHLVIIKVSRGIRAPMELHYTTERPPAGSCVTQDGALWVPNSTLEVAVWSSDGTSRPPFKISPPLGFPQAVGAITVDEASGTLIALSFEGLPDVTLSGRLFACSLDDGSRILWAHDAESGRASTVALLPAFGAHKSSYCVSSSFNDNVIRVFRVHDGALVGSAPTRHPTYIAVDAETRRVYSCVHHTVSGQGCVIEAWDVREDPSTGSVSLAPFAFKGPDDGLLRVGQRPLTLVREAKPSSPAESRAFLIVKDRRDRGLSSFDAIALPGNRDSSAAILEREFSGYHMLPEKESIGGFACCADGTAVIVFDRAHPGLIRVLPFPLPGMPGGAPGPS